MMMVIMVMMIILLLFKMIMINGAAPDDNDVEIELMVMMTSLEMRLMSVLMKSLVTVMTCG